MAHPLLSILVQKNLITEKEAANVEREAREGDTSVETILTNRGLSQEDILSAKGSYLGLPTRAIESANIPFEILKYIPEESAAHYRFVPIGVVDGALEIGIVDPDNIEARDALNFISSKINLPFKLFLITEDDFKAILETYKGLSGEVTKALSELGGDTGEDADLNKDSTQDLTGAKKTGEARVIEDAPVTKIVATVLRYAIEGQASDIHIEPMSDKTRVRFRIDGVLHTSLVLPNNVHRSVVARIKILCNMKLDEHRKPQDGRFSAKIDGRGVDFRVSTFPTYYGEKVVMRILDKEKGVRSLENSGLSKEHLEMVRRAIKKPYGMILISGPTGSGKSTTLYAMLNEVDKETKNVLSLEDPVEFNIDGISQSQVRAEINYTFATGLRTTLRQDPDIIMVGEIRDKETAALAVQAALTGHLVLSTIHTNNAVGVIPRLIDMGVDPYLIAPTLVLAMAQRLVRTLCPGTGKKIPIEGSLKEMVDKRFTDLDPEIREKTMPKDYLYEIDPTPDCPNGTRGRMAVVEMFEMDKDIEAAILRRANEPDIRALVRKKGMLSIQEDALVKCANGLIPFEEVNTLA
jgi:type IV pilus assembly protein PilB